MKGLEQRAREYTAKIFNGATPSEVVKAYIAGATEATKELQAQIDKMKLCANCKHCGVSGWCNKLNRYLLDKANQSCCKWEIKEK